MILLIVDEQITKEELKSSSYFNVIFRKYLKKDIKKLNENELSLFNLPQCNFKDSINIEYLVEKADIILFDYGAYMARLQFGCINYWNRLFIKMIENYSNKKWYCISMLNTFENDEKERLEREYGVEFILFRQYDYQIKFNLLGYVIFNVKKWLKKLQRLLRK